MDTSLWAAYEPQIRELGAQLSAFAEALRIAIPVFLAQPYGYPLLVLILGLCAAYAVIRLRPKRFYFVRHGKSMQNAAHIRQSAGGGLSPEGREQAHTTGVFLSQFPIQLIIASPYERTAETATIIGGVLHKRVRYSKLLVERRNPSEIIGKSADDPEVKKIIDYIDLSYHADAVRYSDEENFKDLKRRARRCLRYLTRAPQNQICVVTHGIFLRMLLAYMAYGRRLNARQYVKVSFFNPADNANVMVCNYRPWRRFTRSRGWEIVTYNLQPPRVLFTSTQKQPAEVMPAAAPESAGATGTPSEAAAAERR